MISIREATSADTKRVCRLFATQLHREPNESLVEAALVDAPSALAFEGEALVGFLYCGYMAPDVMEIMNILVSDSARQRGTGTMMLRFIEQRMPRQISALMLANSTLYPEAEGGKLPATSFYLRNGYSIIADTGATRIFWKSLDSLGDN